MANAENKKGNSKKSEKIEELKNEKVQTLLKEAKNKSARINQKQNNVLFWR